jgi:hypothetical protein
MLGICEEIKAPQCKNGEKYEAGSVIRLRRCPESLKALTRNDPEAPGY